MNEKLQEVEEEMLSKTIELEKQLSDANTELDGVKVSWNINAFYTHNLTRIIWFNGEKLHLLCNDVFWLDAAKKFVMIKKTHIYIYHRKYQIIKTINTIVTNVLN